ncbi:hypothetical protein [Bradyrhizobium oligotrophicum]|uniref:hypothetical protein n=1 Tax=Bradyrhizobium oligotrophicum TaxID=44255 RepID=UPI00366B32A0
METPRDTSWPAARKIDEEIGPRLGQFIQLPLFDTHLTLPTVKHGITAPYHARLPAIIANQIIASRYGMHIRSRRNNWHIRQSLKAWIKHRRRRDSPYQDSVSPSKLRHCSNSSPRDGGFSERGCPNEAQRASRKAR